VADLVASVEHGSGVIVVYRVLAHVTKANSLHELRERHGFCRILFCRVCGQFDIVP
jgi:hypothetical protein